MPNLTAQQTREKLAGAQLYLCTDARTAQGDLAEFADAALAGGVDMLQLRDKTSDVPLDAGHELAALEVLADACDRHGALLAVNDRADIAWHVGADVLHLGQDDLPVTTARELLGHRPVIGRSTHSIEQARAANAESDVDYFCTGPCWPTPTKPGRQAPGLDLVRRVRALDTARPWFAIGGIDHERLDEVVKAGASRAVVVRAITDAADPREATVRLKRDLPELSRA